MVRSKNIFSARFNSGFDFRSRQVIVPNTLFVHSVLKILKGEGFILSYYSVDSKHIVVFLNFSGPNVRLVNSGLSSNRFLSYHKLKAFANSGRVFILQTSEGYMFSQIALLNKLGGALVYEIK